ncbi:cilia- and flagella-associated protein 44 isoform X2 [Polyodon spathula]|uniref:cilia- and flagella-associated protein 44 isoform X2 n=1 Tax=Polyodon spathula TaxID=7913 RepID=UPI001B7F66C2|nr:cilia- and flagella-associated protein 44 isoform X2 [Polyodon spathula]
MDSLEPQGKESAEEKDNKTEDVIKTDGEASTGDSETTTEQLDVSAQDPDRPESESTQQQQQQQQQQEAVIAEGPHQAEEEKPGKEAGEDNEEEDKKGKEAQEKIPEDFYYEYEDICSKPFVSPDSEIPSNLLHLTHSFGYDCTKRANLQLLDDCSLMFAAGNLVVILDIKTKSQKYLRSSSSGRGIGTLMVHPSKKYFVVAENGVKPNIIIYEYPSLRPYRILRGGTEKAYSFVDFNSSGTLLASVGSSPDFMLTVWDWKQEKVMLRSKAFSQDVFRVTFSSDNEGQLTTSGAGHIKFWKMARTFTGLKLQGMLGRFGKTALTDIEGYVELPDGKVVSGSEWGNMLLWDGGLIKVEICRKGGKPCHSGPIHQFVLDEGELITIGADGGIRVWDFEGIDAADSVDDSGLFEIEPMNEMVVDKNVNLYSMVKSCDPDSVIWFAQDANGGIWKLDLSFSNITQDPECLFSFHSGKIQGMDVSLTTHLMATTALDRSVRISDFIAKKDLTDIRFKQGGTTLTWAPRVVNPKGGLIAVGFEDGVVRILEIYSPKGLTLVAGRTNIGDAEIRLKQAFKPHTAPVTAIAYERNGEMMATGSTDNTVFFFTVGDNYEPIGFVRVPGPVQALEWSPASYEKNTLLILCLNGHVVEVQAPDPEKQITDVTFEIQNIYCRHFHFCSIKSKIKRNAEIERRQKVKAQMLKEKEAMLKRKRDLGLEITEEELQEEPEVEEEELPVLYIPEKPSPIYCGFYSGPGEFWLSLGDYDSGFLYHCSFSEQQDPEIDPSKRQDQPFGFIPIQDSENDAIRSMRFSFNGQLLLCGMQSGKVRVYTVQTNDPNLSSMQGFWVLSVHDNQYGHIQNIRSSYDDQFVLTSGEDGNIFVFSLLPQEDISKAIENRRAKVPSPRINLEKEKAADDIVDPNAYSIETAKQKTEMDKMLKEAEEKKASKRKKLIELQNDFKQLLLKNKKLPEHVRLDRAEFELDPRIREETERQTAQRIRLVRKELAWEQEKCRIGLAKLQARFWDSLECDTVMVSAFESEHKVSTYRLLALSKKYHTLQQRIGKKGPEGNDRRKSKAGEFWKDASKDAVDDVDQGDGLKKEGLLQKPGVQTKLGNRQAEKLKINFEKAEKAKAKVEKRKREWEQLYARKPDENYEDPMDVMAIKEAREHMGDFKLKTAKDFTVPEHQRINTEKKRVQLVILEKQTHELKSEMNRKILGLRNFKIESIEKIRSHVNELKVVQAKLDPSKRLPVPQVPRLLPEETPEKKRQYTTETLLRYKQELSTKAKQANKGEQGFGGFSRGLEEPGEERDMISPSKYSERADTACSDTSQACQQETSLSELELEVMQAEEIKNLYLQDSLLKRIKDLIKNFDAELRLLRHHKLKADIAVKMADLRHVTLFEELLLLKEFEKRENSLLEKVNSRIEEQLEIQDKAEECLQQLEAKKRDIAKLQEREKTLHSTFLVSLGENNKFADFLTKVFKKKIKRVKKKEKKGDEEEEEESGEESDEESAWDSDEDDSGSESGALDDSVCPPHCDPALFENTIQLREKRLDIEEVLVEEKKIADNLRKENDSLAKKVKIVQSSLKTAEGDLELFQREKQQRLNELNVVVPLRLHQIEFVSNGTVPGDLSSALVFTNQALVSLQQRIQELQLEKSEQRHLYKLARQQHVQLIRDRRDMEAKIQMLEGKCMQLMLTKFGKVVDLEALKTVSMNKNLEELKVKARINEEEFSRDLKLWEDKIWEVKDRLKEVTRLHTQNLVKMNELLNQKKELETNLDTRQKKMAAVFQEKRQEEIKDRQRLIQLVELQAQEIQALREEISLLSRKGGHILPPAQPPIPTSSQSVV